MALRKAKGQQKLTEIFDRNVRKPLETIVPIIHLIILMTLLIFIDCLKKCISYRSQCKQLLSNCYRNKIIPMNFFGFI